MSTGAGFTEFKPFSKIRFEKPARFVEAESMTSKKKSGSATSSASHRFPEEKGDASTKVLHRTIVVCAVGLVLVFLFATSPRQKSAPATATPSRAEAKAQVAGFDRESLSTKSR